jgi:TrmH family RNA methyltransferase
LGFLLEFSEALENDFQCTAGLTADIYNPKVVQATMGSIARVSVCYTELDSLIEQLPDGTPIYGTLLDGDNIYEQPLTRNGLIIMGNEGNGISPAIRSKVNRRLLIPSYPPDRPTAESLNVAVATALVCSEFRRRV